MILKRDKQQHDFYLEDRFGENVSCVCDNRIKLLIEFGCYRVQDPIDSEMCIYSCRYCQHVRMMQNDECTYRL